METNKIYNSYENGECPDCGEGIPKNVQEGDACKNCEHVFGAVVKTVRCNNCMNEYTEDELQVFTDLGDGTKEVNYFNGCPQCESDKYLMDLE